MSDITGQEVSHGKPCVATAELPPVSLAGLPPPTSQPNPRRSESEKEEEETGLQEAKGFDLMELYCLDTNPERLKWLNSYMEFMISIGKAVSQCPSMNKVRPVSSNLSRFI